MKVAVLYLQQKRITAASTWLEIMAPALPTSNEQSFRANLSQFRWARGVTDDSQPASQPPPQPAGNPFSRFYNAVAGDYIPLRSSERSNEEEAWFALSRWERCVRMVHGLKFGC